MNTRKIIYKTLIYIILVFVSITMLVPFLWMFLTAFKTTAETMQVDPFVIIPKVWQTQNFGNVIRAMDFVRLYANTLGMVALRILFAIATATLSGYAFARLEFKGRNIMFALVLLQMMIPVQIFIIPQYVMVSKMHLTNTIWGLLFPGIVTAFGTYLFKQSFQSLPKELEEAAEIFGGACEENGIWTVYFDENGKDLSRAAENPAGNYVMVAMKKNKTCKPDRRTGFYTLNYQIGIDYLSDLIEVAIKYEIIDKRGAWFNIIDTDTGEILAEKIQGQANLRSYLENVDNESVLTRIEELVENKI